MQELDLGATCDDLELDRILRRSFSLRRRSSALALAPAAMLVTRERERLVLLSALDLRVDVLALGGRARNLRAANTTSRNAVARSVVEGARPTRTASLRVCGRKFRAIQRCLQVFM
uniref:Uncharacterized protein n=1 Tax=Chrysotila carterae TaxID=13221 RepID=A0A7S4BHK1_CHRCT